jgi:exodeoxyribonuclease III
LTGSPPTPKRFSPAVRAVVLAGNVIPKPERWIDDALFRPEVRRAYRNLVAQGWTDALRALHPDARICTLWDCFRNAYGHDAGQRIDHLLLSSAGARRRKAAGIDRDMGKGQRLCACLDAGN